MQKIYTKQECEGLVGLPPPITQRIMEVITTLNEYYGEFRDPDKNLGGYVLLIESEDNFNNLKAVFHMDEFIPEYCDIIPCEGNLSYTVSLILLSSDFSIVLVMPYELTPISLLKYAVWSNGVQSFL